MYEHQRLASQVQEGQLPSQSGYAATVAGVLSVAFDAPEAASGGRTMYE
jgi:hypothetical protein